MSSPEQTNTMRNLRECREICNWIIHSIYAYINDNNTSRLLQIKNDIENLSDKIEKLIADKGTKS